MFNKFALIVNYFSHQDIKYSFCSMTLFCLVFGKNNFDKQMVVEYCKGGAKGM